MNEEKRIKLNLSTVIYMFIILILIIVLIGIVFYFKNKDANHKNEKYKHVYIDKILECELETYSTYLYNLIYSDSDIPKLVVNDSWNHEISVYIYNNDNLDIIIDKQKYDIDKNQVDEYIIGESEASELIKQLKGEKTNKNNIEYKEITNELDKDEIFKIEDVVIENDTITLKGVICKKYKMTRLELDEAVKNGIFEFPSAYRTKYYNVKKDYYEDGVKYDYVFLSKFNGEDFMELYAIKKENDIYNIVTDSEYPNQWEKTKDYRKITLDINTKCIYSLDSYNEETDTVINVFTKKLYFDGFFKFTFKNGKCKSVDEVIIGH